VITPALPAATRGPVHVVGTGLLGTSIGVALRRLGVEVTLADISPLTAAVAAEVGAGRLRRDGDLSPRLVVVGVPPEVTGDVVTAQLTAHPEAVVTDLASVKASVLADVRAAGGDLTRYVGSHPMAGRERSGPAAAMADLFVGRPWVIAEAGSAARSALSVVRDLAVDVGANVVMMDAARHDAAVAVISHVPQVMASLVAARLVDAPAGAVGLAGQGLRDVTRIARSDPMLWATILAGNSREVAGVLRAVRDDLDGTLAALDAAAAGNAGRGVAGLHNVIERGNAGVSTIPGKHGGARADWDVVTVLVPDVPGELGRLFTEVGRAGINLEDVEIEHAGGKPMGLTAICVMRGSGPTLAGALTAAGWRILA
ncbi:MAG: prephenate dehydrogenase, partial [Bifidobacteriaceae bacterium]|jgi:prephenate dehydrogenase|nr:prephenate dehydrogenase [Bifidobacteriaceae bacterium]